MKAARRYSVYFNRRGARKDRAWIVRDDATGRELYFAEVITGVGVYSVYSPRNKPPTPKAWIEAVGVLSVMHHGANRIAVIERE